MGIIQPIEELHREFVGSLAKGLNVIRVFGKDSPDMSVTEVAQGDRDHPRRGAPAAADPAFARLCADATAGSTGWRRRRWSSAFPI